MNLFTKIELSLLRIFVYAIILAPLCLWGVRESVDVEPVVTTWNMYITPIAVGVSTAVIMIFISRLFKRQDSKDEEIKKLSAEKETLKEQNIHQWRETYTDTLCAIKNSVDRIETALNEKVDKEDCIRETGNQWNAINKLRKA